MFLSGLFAESDRILSLLVAVRCEFPKPGLLRFGLLLNLAKGARQKRDSFKENFKFRFLLEK